MTFRISIPASAKSTCDTPRYNDNGVGIADVGAPERTLQYGRILGQVYRVATYDVVVAAGAPGSTTVDLSALIAQDGVALGTGTVVFLETRRIAGSEHAIRKSAANPLAILSGTTDTFLGGGHQVLVDALQNGTLASDAGIAIAAASKNITLESTAGATVSILVGII
jgi:hypothetical protein